MHLVRAASAVCLPQMEPAFSSEPRSAAAGLLSFAARVVGAAFWSVDVPVQLARSRIGQDARRWAMLQLTKRITPRGRPASQGSLVPEGAPGSASPLLGQNLQV